MNHKDRISPNAMNILGGSHKQYTSKYTQSASPLTTEPEKKGWWGRFKDRAKKICTEVKAFCVEAKELLVAAAGALIAADALLKAISKNKKSRKEKDKDSRKKSHYRTRGARSINIINYGTMVWA